MKTLSGKAKKILNDERLIGIRNSWFSKLSGLFSGESFDEVLAVNGILGSSGAVDAYKNPYEWMIASLEELAKRAGEIDNPLMFVPLCVETGHFGVHFVDRIFGADVFFKDNQWNSAYLTSPVGELKAPKDLENDPTVKLVLECVRAYLDADVKLPLFGLPTIASALNIAVNLYGEEILLALMAEPDAAEHDLRIINGVLIELHKLFRRLVPRQVLQPVISWNRTQPPGFGQICGCTTQLLSGRDYERFAAPLDEELLGVYEGGGMIHLCGAHSQHIGTFAKMKKLRAVQLNDRAAEDLEEYFKRLRNDQIIYFNPCDKITVRDALLITRGKRLVLCKV